MKRRKGWAEKKGTLVWQVTSWYIWWFVTVLLFIGLVVLSSVGYFLLERVQQEQEVLETNLLLLLEEEKAELQPALDEVLYPEYADYGVEIRQSGQVIARSRGWEETGADGESIRIPGFDRFVLKEGDDLFYIREVSWEADGEAGTIWFNVELDNEMEFFLLLFQILFYTGLFSLVIGSILIYRLTQKSLKPLLVITSAVEKMKGYRDLEKRMPVPDKPQELTNLAAAFNHLLEQLGEQFEREQSFVSNASHELRTPLTAFRGHLKLLKRWGKNDPEILEQAIEAMDHESGRMERMMAQLLTLARNEYAESKRDPVNLTAMLEKVIEQFSAIPQVKMKVKLEENVVVNGDGEQIRQVVVILLENARRYTTEGNITVRLIREGSKILFSVTDTGIGIAPADQKKVFDRFYRVDKARSRESGGTGLGLAIARDLVENHEGRILLKSEPGAGSTFTVVLPAPE